VVELDEKTRRFIDGHRVARLATVDRNGAPLVVPICYAFLKGDIFSAIDAKPKSVEANKLRRVRNIQENPNVALVIDDYSDDWSQLVYVLITGRAAILSPGSPYHQPAVAALRKKYRQYETMPIGAASLIEIIPERIKLWEFGQE